ncbi:metal-sulfur cluster assembly factor [Candidatus Uhrbacteria bacterium]|nr:metal-sulfur cluster assembly factor [Candidatus Uhrbacteria bacterium]
MKDTASKHTPLQPTSPDERKAAYWSVVNNVIDPELGVGIVDLGLVYGIAIKKGIATVRMTLTSMGCPAGPEIMRRVEAELGTFPGVRDVKIDLVWEPVWGPDMINPDIRSLIM